MEVSNIQRRGLNIPRGMKYATEVPKYSTEVSTIPQFQGGAERFHGRVKYSTEGAKCSTEGMSPRRYEIFHGGA